MELTHFGHACVLMQTAITRVLIDPGTLSAAFESLRELDAVVITHQHADHLDITRLLALLAANPGVSLLVDPGSAPMVQATGLPFRMLEVGDRLRIGGSDLEVVGGVHALVHADIPVVPNCALVIDDGAFYHPGDSFFVPAQSVDVFAIPVSGPWLKAGEAIDFLRSVRPRVAVPIHEAALSNTATHFGMLAGHAPGGTTFRPLEPAVPSAV